MWRTRKTARSAILQRRCSTWCRLAATFITSYPRPTPATTSARTRLFWSARSRRVERATTFAGTTGPHFPPFGAPYWSKTNMTTAEILASFPKLSALVVGDICLDRWCTYDPSTSEPSAETGIPRVGVVATEVTPGGGGTVANNLAALGAGRVAVLGVRGDDGFGFELERALAERRIEADLMVKIRDWQTFTYSKPLNSQTNEED